MELVLLFFSFLSIIIGKFAAKGSWKGAAKMAYALEDKQAGTFKLMPMDPTSDKSITFANVNAMATGKVTSWTAQKLVSGINGMLWIIGEKATGDDGRYDILDPDSVRTVNQNVSNN